MKKITRTNNGVIVRAPETALAKMMSNGFLARTSLAKWLLGSLGINSALFATALLMSVSYGVNVVTYGVVTVTVDSVIKNGVCVVIKATATANGYYGTETASVKVIYDYNGGKTASKYPNYKPLTKTENGFDIGLLDNEPINFDGIAIDIQ